jgi:hypothetical protein
MPFGSGPTPGKRKREASQLLHLPFPTQLRLLRLRTVCSWQSGIFAPRLSVTILVQFARARCAPFHILGLVESKLAAGSAAFLAEANKIASSALTDCEDHEIEDMSHDRFT